MGQYIIVGKYLLGINDDITKSKIDSEQMLAAVGVAVLFANMAEQKAIRIGTPELIKEAKSVQRDFMNMISKLPSNVQNSAKKVICNIEELHKIIQRDNAILLEKYDAITKSNSIKFKCQL